MSEKERNEEIDRAAGVENLEAANDAQAELDGPELAEAAALGEELEAYKAELSELKDRLMRAVAETENLRRRAEREKAEASAYAATGFARDLLDVGDNLRRALESVPEEARDNNAVSTLVAGVELTERTLLNAFEKHGIRKVTPEGERFDPNLHQAMFEVETADAAPGTVVQVVQPGYVIKDRLLRPAMVGVAKATAAKKGEAEAQTGIDETV